MGNNIDRPPSQTLRAILPDKKVVIDDIVPKYGLNSFLGLMFRQQGRALIELPQNFHPAIHTFFMRFSLDLIFLRGVEVDQTDSRDELRDYSHDLDSYSAQIVHIETNARPWHNFTSPEPADYALEVEAGLVEERGIEEGDLIKLAPQAGG